jgi:VWFA-related protein
MKRAALAAAVALIASGGAIAREPPTVSNLGVSVDLVQVDAVVTDHHGQPLVDLRSEDFRVFEDGRSQTIANFAFIPQVVAATPAPPAGAPTPEPAPAAPATAAPRPPLVRARILVFVVDDLSLSPGDLGLVKRALGKILDKLPPSDDRMGLTVTSAPALLLTSDPQLMRESARSLAWNPRSNHFRTVPQIGIGFVEGKLGQRRLAGSEVESSDDVALRAARSVAAVAQALERLPGRKTVIFFSGGLRAISIRNENSRGSRREEGKGIVEAGIQSLSDTANRSSVVVYTIDARGLASLTMQADDYVNVPGFIQIQESELVLRRREFRLAQEGLRELADETGGLFFGGSDPGVGLTRALESEQGYYLLGYPVQHDAEVAKPRHRAYHEIQVKVTRPHCRVRARSRVYSLTPPVPAGG